MKIPEGVAAIIFDPNSSNPMVLLYGRCILQFPGAIWAASGKTSPKRRMNKDSFLMLVK
jgi:hypothetical protein